MDKNNTKKVTAQGVETSNLPVNEPTVREIGKHLPAVTKKAMELPLVIKTVEELFTIVKHRDRLEMYEDKLADFEVKKRDEDLNDQSYYSGCMLTITDDNRNEFKLKHPVIIKEVIDVLRVKFAAKRKELEKKIVLPAA